MKEKLKKIGGYAIAILETVVSAIVIVALYVCYLPFGVIRSLFDPKAIRDFYSDVFFVLDGISDRIRGRKGVAK